MPRRPPSKDSVAFDQYVTAQHLQRKHPEKLRGWTLADIEAAVVREWNTPFMRQATREAFAECRPPDLKGLLAE